MVQNNKPYTHTHTHKKKKHKLKKKTKNKKKTKKKKKKTKESETKTLKFDIFIKGGHLQRLGHLGQANWWHHLQC